jgi:hypothetical protein
MGLKDYIDEFEKEKEMEISELKRFIEFLDIINDKSMYKFKYRLNNKKNVYLIITSNNFERKIETSADFKSKRITATCLDKKGYEISFEFNGNKTIKNDDDFFEFLGLSLKDYQNSKEIKSF